MLVMMAVIVDKCVSNFLYSTGGALNRHGARSNFALPLDGSRCINNVLINALKQINALTALVTSLQVHLSLAIFTWLGRE